MTLVPLGDVGGHWFFAECLQFVSTSGGRHSCVDLHSQVMRHYRERNAKMAQNNVSNTDWTALRQAEDVAYFRADLCLYSPESYRLEESATRSR